MPEGTEGAERAQKSYFLSDILRAGEEHTTAASRSALNLQGGHNDKNK